MSTKSVAPRRSSRPVPRPAPRSGTMAKVAPTGKCWCGCGAEVAENAFFLPGHDRAAEATFVKEEYGSLVEMLEHHGYHEGRKTTPPPARVRKTA